MKKKTQMLGKMLLTTMMMALTLPQATASGFTVSYSNVEQQQEILVEGRVLDAQGNPLLGVNVIVKGTQRGVATDKDGYYAIRADENDVLIFKSLGFHSQEVAVQGRTLLNVHLKVAQEELSEVTVTSTGIKRQIKDFAGTVNIVSSAQIKELALPAVGDAVRFMPGVNYIDEDGRGLRPGIGLRGIDPARNSNTLVVIDGKIPIGQSYSDMGGYYMMPVGAIESIEVIKGASPALYGSGSIGGVVNIITKKGAAQPYTNLNLQYGNHNALNIGVETVGNTNEGAMNYYAGFHRRQGDGFRKSRSRYAVNDFTGNVTTKVGEKNEWRFFVNGFTEYSDTPGGLSQAQWDADPEQSVNPHDFFEARRFSTAISYKRLFDENNSLTTSIYGSYLKRDWWLDNRNTDATKRKFTSALRDIPSLGLFSDYERTNTLFGKENKLLAGIRLHADITHNVSVEGDKMGVKEGKTTANSANTVAVVEGYVFDEFHITDKFNINPGLRYTFVNYDKEDYFRNQWDNTNEDAFIYSLGLFYKFSEKYRAYFSYSKGYKMPQIREAFVTNGDLDAEKSNNYELGLRTQPTDWLELELAAYILDFDHKIFREGGLLNNGDKALHRGIEVSGSIYPIEGLKLYGSGAIQKATIEYGTYKGNIVPYAPHYTATAGAKYQFTLGEGTLTINSYANFVSSQFSDKKNTEIGSADGNVGAIPKFFLLNATANYNIKKWNVNLNALNLLNRKYFTTRHRAWGGIMPAATISVLAGVGYQF